MVTLKCDVCGGSLIMQPGATAKCGSCGMDYSTQMLSEKFAKQNTPEISNSDRVGSETIDNSTASLGTALATSNEESDCVIPSYDYNYDSQRIFVDENDSESRSMTYDNGSNNTKKMAWIVIGIIAVFTIVLIAVSQGNKNDNNEYSHDTVATNGESSYIDEDDTVYSNNIGTDYVQWTNKDVCNHSSGDYTFLMDSSAYEIITPTFEVYSSSILVSTALEFEEAGNYYTDKSRYFNVELYDASNDTLVNYYTGMYDNVEGGVDFSTERNHSYYLKISTYVESGEKTHGHGHIYLD